MANINSADNNLITPVVFPLTELARIVELTQTMSHSKPVVTESIGESTHWLEATIVPVGMVVHILFIED